MENALVIIKEIKEFKKENERYDFGKIGNQILYNMCKKYPYHKDIFEIIAKVWLIGRSYAVSIERNKNNKNISDDFYSKKVGPKFKNGFDKILSDIRNLRELKKENIPIILKTHKEVVHFINRKITGDDKRSFASKYLHFHFPDLFFIYDSRAAGTISNVLEQIGYKSKDVKQILKDVKIVDERYAIFFVKCFLFSEFCKKNKISLTIRQTDSFLIEIANNKKRNKI